MHRLDIRLFGRPKIEYRGRTLEEWSSIKVKELFFFLLLHHDRPVSRESVASILCNGDGSTGRSRKYLRNVLWGLRSTLDSVDGLDLTDVLLTDRDWIELHITPRIWLDVDVFDRAAMAIGGIPSADLTTSVVEMAARAAKLYTDPLLSSLKDEWCEKERDRLHHRYLFMLDRLAEYDERTGFLERAILRAEEILAWDAAHERTHRRLMRLYMRLGDRTGALRQYDACQSALREELDVQPGPRTVVLFEHIRKGVAVLGDEESESPIPGGTD